MFAATKLRSPVKPAVGRAILGPTGNRFRVSEELRRKTEIAKKKTPPSQQPQQRRMKSVAGMPDSAVRTDFSVDSSSSTDSSSSASDRSPVKISVVPGRAPTRTNGVMRSVKAITDGVTDGSPRILGPVKRCDWITPNSDTLYASFHDEEWGVPVHDDTKLFELLVYSQALAELSWPSILHKREIFRKFFDDFNPSSIVQFSMKRLLSLKVDGALILSEQKLRAIVENAKSVLKVQQEFGSFSNYCWRFVKDKPLRNGYRYGRQVPVKSPKAEFISKDMMQRGFCCVGPTVVYSFLQVAGIVNDHLTTCFRYHECVDQESRAHKTVDGENPSLTSGQ
ncbi:PREDICTED: uncharacterized protein LOC104813844 [Tarenaya hassleriana]|uniref:uncharacterized protein LOC104813844 n=1 Tax=Tarenaya hassleriana TaxID=28532 RepID=UPI00053C3CD5|nr:PREDICTED: uncharacterized protein LOC104813844 [Tarenaya hassleriana]